MSQLKISTKEFDRSPLPKFMLFATELTDCIPCNTWPWLLWPCTDVVFERIWLRAEAGIDEMVFTSSASAGDAVFNSLYVAMSLSRWSRSSWLVSAVGSRGDGVSPKLMLDALPPPSRPLLAMLPLSWSSGCGDSMDWSPPHSDALLSPLSSSFLLTVRRYFARAFWNHTYQDKCKEWVKLVLIMFIIFICQLKHHYCSLKKKLSDFFSRKLDNAWTFAAWRERSCHCFLWFRHFDSYFNKCS